MAGVGCPARSKDEEGVRRSMVRQAEGLIGNQLAAMEQVKVLPMAMGAFGGSPRGVESV